MDIPVLHRNLLKYCNKTTCTTPGLGEINLSTPAVEASCDSLTSLKKKKFLHTRQSGQWGNQGVSHAPFAVCWSLAGIQFQFPQLTEHRRAAHTDRYKLLQWQTLISKCRSNGRAKFYPWPRDSDSNWGRVISLSVSLPIRQEISGTCPITTHTEWSQRQRKDPVTSCSSQIELLFCIEHNPLNCIHSLAWPSVDRKGGRAIENNGTWCVYVFWWKLEGKSSKEDDGLVFCSARLWHSVGDAGNSLQVDG